MSYEVILSHIDFNKGFDIYVDTSNMQLGTVISKDSKSIVFLIANWLIVSAYIL